MIDFNAAFNIISDISFPPELSAVYFYHYFSTIFCHWLLSHNIIVETMVGGEKGINPTALTITNPRKETVRAQGRNLLLNGLRFGENVSGGASAKRSNELRLSHRSPFYNWCFAVLFQSCDIEISICYGTPIARI